MKRNKAVAGFENDQTAAITELYDPRLEIDVLLSRDEQAFKLRQYALNEHQRDALKTYGRSLVEQAVDRIEELHRDSQ